MSYFFSEAARVEHLEHVAYYEEQRHGLGARYLAAFEVAMVKVCAVIGVRRQFRFGAKHRTLRASLWLSEFGL